jgi:hypothetical protein
MRPGAARQAVWSSVARSAGSCELQEAGARVGCHAHRFGPSQRGSGCCGKGPRRAIARAFPQQLWLRGSPIRVRLAPSHTRLRRTAGMARALISTLLLLACATAAAQSSGTCPATASGYAATSCYMGWTSSMNLGPVCSCYCAGSSPNVPDNLFLVGTTNGNMSMTSCSVASCATNFASIQSSSTSPCFVNGAIAGYASAITTNGLPPPAATTMSPPASCITRSRTCNATYVGLKTWCPSSAFIGMVLSLYDRGPPDLATCSSSYNNAKFTNSFCSTNNCNAPPPPPTTPPPTTASDAIATRSAFALAAALVAAAACL